MIIRKPFKFLIEHFKIINIILMLLIGFVTFKLFNLMHFFANFVTNSYTTREVDLALHYIGYLLPLAIIVIIVMNIIIYILFKSKDKDTKLYLASTCFYIILFVFTFIYRGTLDNFEFNTIASQTGLLYRDVSKFTFYPNFIFLIFYFLNVIGFDLTTFEFTNLRDDIDIAKEDDAEIEIGIKLEDYKIKRFLNKKIRELRYYVVDNKLVFMGFGGIIALIFAILGINGLIKLNNNIRIDKSFTYSNFSITVENSYLTKLDYGGNLLSDKYHYLVLVLAVTNKSKTPKELDTDNFWLQIGSTSYIYPILDKSTYFKDLGEPYYKDKIEVNKTHKYVLCYQILDKEISNSYTIKILDSVKYVNGEGTPTYKKLKVSPRENDKIIDKGTYLPGETLSFDTTTLKESSLVIDDYNLTDNYTYSYNFCQNDNCTLKKNAITNNSNTKKTLIVLDNLLTLDDTSNYSMYGTNDFYNNFVTFEYIYNDTTYTSSVTDKSASNDISGNKVLEVDYNMKYATSINMIITIRNMKYTISLL